MAFVVDIIGQRYEMVGLLFEADCVSLVPQAYSSLGGGGGGDRRRGVASFDISAVVMAVGFH